MKAVLILLRLALLTLVAVATCPRSLAQDVGADTVIDVPTPPGVRIFPNFAYVEGGSPRQKLDLYLPSPVPKDPMPLIVYLHGGGWQKGSKADGRRFAFRMVAQGYAVACADYRLSSDELFPAQIEDCKAAVRWLRDSATRYRINPDHFGVVGVSAGGYLAVMLGVTGSTRLFDEGEHLAQSSSVQAVCDFFGPIDLIRLHEYSIKAQTPQAGEVVSLLGGDPHVQKLQTSKSSPFTYLNGNAPPFLLVHGTNDTVVPPEQSRLLYDALVKQNLPVHLHLIHEAGHTGPGFVTPEINGMVDDFFARVLNPGSQPPAATTLITESTAKKD